MTNDILKHTGGISITNGFFEFCGESFFCDMSWGTRKESESSLFTIVKNEQYFDTYIKLLNIQVKSLVEVGFLNGGSSVFFDLMYSPESFTAIDRRKDKIIPVHHYIERKKRNENFRLLYGFDQGDTESLIEMVQKYHGGGIDMVIDDASHQYELTKKTFSVLFPHMRPGGTYVIEDHGWAHDRRYQDLDHVWSNRPALTNFIFELTMLNSSRSDIVSSIYINSGMCLIKKGAAQYLEPPFDPVDHILCRGRNLGLV